MLAGQDRLAGTGCFRWKMLFALYPVAVTAAQASRFCNGGALSLERLRTPVKSPVRVHGPRRVFLGWDGRGWGTEDIVLIRGKKFEAHNSSGRESSCGAAHGEKHGRKEGKRRRPRTTGGRVFCREG